MRVKITPEDLLKGKILPPGWYTCEITQVEEKLANTDKSQNWNFHFTVVDGSFKGVKIYQTFNEKATGRFVPLLEALGTSVPQGGTDFDPQRLTGKVLRVSVQNKQYEGELKNQVAGFAPRGEQKSA